MTENKLAAKLGKNISLEKDSQNSRIRKINNTTRNKD